MIVEHIEGTVLVLRMIAHLDELRCTFSNENVSLLAVGFGKGVLGIAAELEGVLDSKLSSGELLCTCCVRWKLNFHSAQES